jgi:hypothetical protein
MRNLLSVVALTAVTSVSFSALAQAPAGKAEPPKSPEAQGEHAEGERHEGKGERHEGKGEHAEGEGEHHEGGHHHGKHHGEHHGEHAEGKGDLEGGEEEGEEAEAKFFAGADMVLGFGDLPAEGDITSSALTGSFLLGGKYFLTPAFALGARWPFTAGSIKENNAVTGTSESKGEVAVGNLELAGEYQVPIAKHVKLPIELGLALPTASGDEFAGENDAGRIRRAKLNEAAAAARGGENNALFAAHRFGIIPLLGLEYEHGHIEAAIWTKMEVLIKAGGKAPPEGSNIEVKSVAAESVTGAGFHYWLMDEHLGIGTRVWFSAALADEVENSNADFKKPSKFGFVLEPGIKVKAGAFRPSLSYILPLVGDLGPSSRKMGGVRLVLGLAY